MPRLPRKVPRRHRRPIPAQARHQSQPSAISATPATQNEGGCHQVPRLPRETKVDVNECHPCHAKYRGVTGDQARPSAPPEPAQCHKCHACHAKRRWMSRRATPAVQNEGGCHMLSPSATPAMPNQGRCRQVPRLPRKTKIDAAKCHACHAKRRFLSPSATHATQS